MPDAPLRLVIRTPHAAVLDEDVAGVRVPTETGLVGLRPGGEPLTLVVEPGLVVVHTRGGGDRFAASAGGLLECTRERCTVYTPFVVVGGEDEVVDALGKALATPGSEIDARRRLGELEQRILEEVREPSRRVQRGSSRTLDVDADTGRP